MLEAPGAGDEALPSPLLLMPGGTGLQVKSRRTRVHSQPTKNSLLLSCGEKMTFVAFLAGISGKQGHLRRKNPYATKDLLMSRPSVLSETIQRS